MIIISKKRIAIISVILLISVFAFTFKTANLNGENNFNGKSNLDKTVQTVSLPVSNKVIVLDAGHR